MERGVARSLSEELAAAGEGSEEELGFIVAAFVRAASAAAVFVSFVVRDRGENTGACGDNEGEAAPVDAARTVGVLAESTVMGGGGEGRTGGGDIGGAVEATAGAGSESGVALEQLFAAGTGEGRLACCGCGFGDGSRLAVTLRSGRGCCSPLGEVAWVALSVVAFPSGVVGRVRGGERSATLGDAVLDVDADLDFAAFFFFFNLLPLTLL